MDQMMMGVGGGMFQKQLTLLVYISKEKILVERQVES